MKFPSASRILAFTVILLFLSPPVPAPAEKAEKEEDAGKKQCIKLPSTYSFNLQKSAVPVGMNIVAGCDGPMWHAFILEVLSEGESGQRDIQIRFVPGRKDPDHMKLKWIGKKLLRIKNASTAIGQVVKGKKHSWAVMYAKHSTEGKLSPTLALLTVNEKEKTFATRLFKFGESEKFFSPLIFDRKSGVAVFWGEEKNGKLRIVHTVVDMEKMEATGKKELATGAMLDRFFALQTEKNITLAWLEEPPGGGDCLDVFTGKFTGAGENIAVVKDVQICGEAVFTGIRVMGKETIVEGMEGRKGRWRPFEIITNFESKKAEIKRKKSPSILYDSTFVMFSKVIMWKKRHEDGPVRLEFFNETYDVSGEGAGLPLALSLCETSAVGGWLHRGNGKKWAVRFFDIQLKDSDADGVLDDFDACSPGDGTGHEEEVG